MKGAIATAYGDGSKFDDILDIKTDWDMPKRGKGQLLVRVQACSLAPGDVRTLSGWTKLFQVPKGGFPYIPGGDVTGVVEEADEATSKFKVGDAVVSRFFGTPSGGLAEYAVVETRLTALKPPSLSIEEAAAIPASPIVALRLSKTWVRKGDRVLVIGGSGGVGSHLLQLLKGAGASFVAATGTRTDTLKSLGADLAINYKEKEWWEVPELKSQKLDLIIDLAAPGKELEAWRHGKKLLKSGRKGGRFIAQAGPKALFKVQNTWQALGMARKMLWDSYYTKFIPWMPRYKWWVLCLADLGDEEEWADLFRRIEKGELRVITDPSGPFPFTPKGIRDAFRLQESRHALGKVVVRIDQE